MRTVSLIWTSQHKSITPRDFTSADVSRLIVASVVSWFNIVMKGGFFGFDLEFCIQTACPVSPQAEIIDIVIDF